MTDRHPLRLSFGPQIQPTARRRVDYAFRVFCATYGFTPVESDDAPTLGYGLGPGATRHVSLTAGYQARPNTQPAAAPRWVPLDSSVRRNGASDKGFPCFHGADGIARPDWLGELFEWISGAHEYSVTQTDAIGRLAYDETLHGRYQLDPLVPYAALAMHGLNSDIRSFVGPQWPSAPVNPWPDALTCAIAATHDVDFLPVSLAQDMHRLLKDLAIAGFLHRDPKQALAILGRSVRVLAGARAPLDTLVPLLQREQEHGIRSTCCVIPRRAHRRDATYDLHDPKVHGFLEKLVRAGAEIALHGSYTSLESKGRLAEEYQELRKAGFPAVGGRQHWLRYRTGAELIEEIRAAGGWYDCTFGYRTRPGFRNGACFPFPPYNFAAESAFPVLELPLVIMDTTLDEMTRRGEDALPVCRQILSTVRQYGWGGTSILWHDTTFGNAAMRPEVGEIYWQIKGENDLWMPAAELVKAVWPRYAAAGLVPSQLPAATPVETHR